MFCNSLYYGLPGYFIMFSKEKITTIKSGFEQKQVANRMMASNPVPKYTDLLSESENKTAVNIPYEPKPFFSKRIMRKLRWRIFVLSVYKFFGSKKVK